MKQMSKSQDSSPVLYAIFQSIVSAERNRRNPITFERVKPIIIAMIQGKSMLKLSREENAPPYITLYSWRTAALEFINPLNSKRKMTKDDEEWLIKAYATYSRGNK